MKKLLLGLLCITALIGCGNHDNADDKEPLEAVQINTEEECYDDGKAMIEPPSGDAAVEGYVEYLRKNGLFDENEVGYGAEAVYQLIYLDEDDVPELIYGSTEAVHGSNIYILMYKDFGSTVDDIVKIGPFGAYNMTSYLPRKNIICTSNTGMGIDGVYYSTINKETMEFESVAYEEHSTDFDEEYAEDYYHIGTDYREVTKDTYESFISDIMGEDSFIDFNTYENTEGYHWLNEEALDNNLYSEEFFTSRIH